jgi:FKBP-type peptidyl-prolyl cis-trans isomerase 2
MSLRARFAVLLAAAIAIAAPLAAEEKAQEKTADKAPAKAPAAAHHTVVEKGSKVSVEYTLSTDGKVVESNAGKEALVYEHGAGKMLPAFEAHLAGLGAGGTKEFDLAPEQAYGPVHKELYHEVDAKDIPAESRKADAMLMAQAKDGRQQPVRVREVKGDKIVLDYNHPLAGKKLHFAVKVLSVE